MLAARKHGPQKTRLYSGEECECAEKVRGCGTLSLRSQAYITFCAHCRTQGTPHFLLADMEPIRASSLIQMGSKWIIFLGSSYGRTCLFPQARLISDCFISTHGYGDGSYALTLVVLANPAQQIRILGE